MSDESLIAGAAAPVGTRRIRSTVVLDAMWVIVTAAGLIVSSRTALIDLPNQYLRTGDAPLRIWVVGLPLVALFIAIGAIVRRSPAVAAAATGILAPAVAVAGSLAASLFLDDSSAFADAGVAVSLAASLIGVSMLVRWFVYHPADVMADESRPLRAFSLAVVVVGIATALVVVVDGVLGDGSWSSSFVFQTMLIVVVPVVVASCGVVRTRPAMMLAAGAALAQLLGVLVVRVEQPSLALDADVMLRTGVPGIVLLIATAGLCLLAFSRHGVDEPVDVTDDDADWRWTSSD